MTDSLLGHVLKSFYDSAPKGDKVASIHVFSIYYADMITDGNKQVNEIIKYSGLPESYHTEVSKGIKLSKYVLLTEDIVKKIQIIQEKEEKLSC